MGEAEPSEGACAADARLRATGLPARYGAARASVLWAKVAGAELGGGTCGAMAEGSGEVVAVPATGAANGLNNGAGGPSAQTNNPLSRKLRKILDTRLDNDKVNGTGGVEGAASSAGRTRAGGGVCPAPSGSSLSPPRRGPQVRGTRCAAVWGR